MNPIYWYLLMDATNDTPDSMMSVSDGDAFLLLIIMLLCIVFVGICVKFLWDISK